MSYVRMNGGLGEFAAGGPIPTLNWAAASQAIAEQTAANVAAGGTDPFAAAQVVLAQMAATEAAKSAAQLASEAAARQAATDLMVSNALALRNAEIAAETARNLAAQQALATQQAAAGQVPVEDHSGGITAGPGAGQPVVEQPEDHSGGFTTEAKYVPAPVAGPPWLLIGAAAFGLYLLTKKG